MKICYNVRLSQKSQTIDFYTEADDLFDSKVYGYLLFDVTPSQKHLQTIW